MVAKHSISSYSWGRIALFAGLYFLLALVSLDAARRADGIALIWPSSGIAVGGLLILPRRDRWLLLPALFVASTGGNMLGGSSLGVALWFSVANLVEAVVCVRIARPVKGLFGALDRPAWIVRFVAGAVTGSLASAILAGFVPEASDHWLNFVTSWFCTVLLGIVIIVPVVLAVARRIREAGGMAVQMPPASLLALLGLTALTSLATFSQNELPLLFLPPLAVILATFVNGMSGAALSVLVVAVVGAIFTSRGSGPVQFVDGDSYQQALFFQFYLFTIFASALPLASQLMRTRVAAEQLAETNRLLSAAEQTAHVGHWRVELGQHDVFWSDEVYAIHGLPAGPAPSLKVAIAAYHPDDRAAVNAVIEQSIASCSPFSFRARVVQPDGSIRHVESSGQPEMVDGKVRALFGVILDVTERVLAHDALVAAHEEAKRQTNVALKLAETDQLTGLANRRKFMERLDAEFALREGEDIPLAIVMFDVDHFKVINDTYGHAVGDEVLTAIAQEAQRHVRQRDLLCRLGGEEFAVLMPGANRDAAMAGAERIRLAIESLQLDTGSREPQFTVSVSLGVGMWEEGADTSWLMQSADNALYEAKNSGRNCLRLAA